MAKEKKIENYIDSSGHKIGSGRGLAGAEGHLTTRDERYGFSQLHYDSNPEQGGDILSVVDSDFDEMLRSVESGDVELGGGELEHTGKIGIDGVMNEVDAERLCRAFDTSVKRDSSDILRSSSLYGGGFIRYITLSSGTRLCSMSSLAQVLGLPMRATTLLLNRLRIPLLHLRGEAFYFEKWLDFVLESILAPNNIDFFAPGSYPLARGEGKFDEITSCTMNDGKKYTKRSETSGFKGEGRQRTPLDGRKGRVAIDDEFYNNVILPGVNKLMPLSCSVSVMPVLKKRRGSDKDMDIKLPVKMGRPPKQKPDKTDDGGVNG